MLSRGEQGREEEGGWGMLYSAGLQEKPQCRPHSSRSRHLEWGQSMAGWKTLILFLANQEIF